MGFGWENGDSGDRAVGGGRRPCGDHLPGAGQTTARGLSDHDDGGNNYYDDDGEDGYDEEDCYTSKIFQVTIAGIKDNILGQNSTTR